MRVLGLFALILLQLQLSWAGKPSCPNLGKWIEMKERILVSPGHLERVALSAKEWDVREAIAQQLFEKFDAGTFDRTEIDACLKGKPYAGNFLNNLHQAFYRGSLEKLLSGKSKGFQELALLINQRRQNGRLPFFRITGFLEEKSPAIFEAGYHSGADSIYMDIGRVSKDQWYIHFMHEIVHGLDDLIFPAHEKYIDPKKFALYDSWAKQYSHPDQLSEGQRMQLFEWLGWGLERGLWSEYRASVVSVLLYLDGIHEGLWGRSQRLDEVLALKPRDQALEHFIYQYLDDVSQPKENRLYVDQDKFFGRSLAIFCERFRKEGRLPALGALSAVLEAAGSVGQSPLLE